MLRKRNKLASIPSTLGVVGYDLISRDLPQEVASLQDEWFVAMWDNDPQPDLSDRYFRAVEPYSLHLNVAAMGFCRERLRRVGGLAEGPAPIAFPDEPVIDTAMYGSRREWRLANIDRWHVQVSLEKRWAAQVADGRLGIAEFKLSSNDGWFVTPTEVEQSFAALSATGHQDSLVDDEADFWRRWESWLERCASSGFDVF